MSLMPRHSAQATLISPHDTFQDNITKFNAVKRNAKENSDLRKAFEGWKKENNYADEPDFAKFDKDQKTLFKQHISDLKREETQLRGRPGALELMFDKSSKKA